MANCLVVRVRCLQDIYSQKHISFTVKDNVMFQVNTVFIDYDNHAAFDMQ